MRFPIFLPARRDLVARNARREARIHPAWRQYYRLRKALVATAIERAKREGVTVKSFVNFMDAVCPDWRRP